MHSTAPLRCVSSTAGRLNTAGCTYIFGVYILRVRNDAARAGASSRARDSEGFRGWCCRHSWARTEKKGQVYEGVWGVCGGCCVSQNIVQAQINASSMRSNRSSGKIWKIGLGSRFFENGPFEARPRGRSGNVQIGSYEDVYGGGVCLQAS